jgi:hypothetical protein
MDLVARDKRHSSRKLIVSACQPLLAIRFALSKMEWASAERETIIQGRLHLMFGFRKNVKNNFNIKISLRADYPPKSSLNREDLGFCLYLIFKNDKKSKTCGSGFWLARNEVSASVREIFSERKKLL